MAMLCAGMQCSARSEGQVLAGALPNGAAIKSWLGAEARGGAEVAGSRVVGYLACWSSSKGDAYGRLKGRGDGAKIGPAEGAARRPAGRAGGCRPQRMPAPPPAMMDLKRPLNGCAGVLQACSGTAWAPMLRLRCSCSEPEPSTACRPGAAADEPPAGAAGGCSAPPPAAGCCCWPVLLLALPALAALVMECCRRTTPGTLTYTSGSSSFCKQEGGCANARSDAVKSRNVGQRGRRQRHGRARAATASGLQRCNATRSPPVPQ